ncbi:MAG: stage II sporulation protein M [Oscillospiraceae bacterium]|nr:stage II sporulation protein M [Oscillospiraceae bacterium]
MGRRKKWKVDLLSGRTAALCLLCVLFFAGSVAGCVAAGAIRDDGGVLAEYLRNYLDALERDGALLRYFPILWQTIRFPLAVFLLGLTALGIVALPVLFAVRGFAFSYAVSVLFRLLGGRGLLLAAALFGVSAVLWMPALFELGVQGLLASYSLFRRVGGDGRYPLCYSGKFFVRSGICAAALALCAGVEYFVIPLFLRMIAGVL